MWNKSGGDKTGNHWREGKGIRSSVDEETDYAPGASLVMPMVWS
jgi:hypothetical protein